MENHFLRSSLFIAVCYIMYLLLVRREDKFFVNRIYLLSGILMAILLPFLPKLNLGTTTSEIVNLIDGIELTGTTDSVNNNTSDLINPMMIIYLSGVTWFTLRFLSGMGRIVYLYLRLPRSTVNGLTMVELEEDQTPFTFFNILFISKSDLGPDGNTSIFQHEIAHIRQLHSLDVIIAELACILFWFNPFMWLIKSALKAEHEFAADDRVMREGYNQLSYQRLLLERTMGASMISLANNFNYSLLKNRILMMTKYKSSKRKYLKYYFAFPLLAFVIACSLGSTDAAQTDKDKVYDTVEVMPEFPGGMHAVKTHIAKNIIYPETAKTQGVEAKIFVQFIVSEDGSVQNPEIMRTDVKEKVEDEIVVVAYTPEKLKPSSTKDALLALEEEALRVVATIPDFKPGMQDGKPVKVRYTFPIKFALQ